MKRIKLLLLSAFVCLGLSNALAQTKVAGLVTSSEDGQPIPGVTIIVKGISGVGTTTNIDGKYSISVPASGKTLVFSYIGFVTQEIPLQGKMSLNVVLIPDSKKLDEVVVTALGITRAKKALGYSVQNVKSEELSRTAENNVLNTLSSKIAGLQVISSGGSPGSSSKILIRGNSSFTGENQPLIVVDGVPIDNSTTGTVAGDYPYNANLQGVNNSNRALDINPDDIENVTVLKGPSAAALYGARAANGAIVYTTKKGKSGAPRITYGFNAEFNEVNKLPDEQKVYAQGQLDNGVPVYKPGQVVDSWGPSYKTLSNVNIYNNTDEFFKTSAGYTHNLSLTGGAGTNTYRASVSRLDQNGIIPNTDFRRTSFRINAESNILDNLTMSGSFSYTNSGGTKAQNGSNLSGVMLPLMRAPLNFDLANFKNADGSSNNYVPFYDNPYWSVYNNPFKDQVDRVLASGVLVFKPYSWISGTYKAGADVYTDRRKQIFAIGSNNIDDLGGQIEEHTVRFQQYYQDALISLNKTWIEKLTTSLNIGGNLTHTYTQALYGRGKQLTIPYFYNLASAKDRYSSENNSTIRSSALFFDGSIGWDTYLFVNFTGRNEWSSTFAQKNNNFFYPSVSASFVFSELVKENPYLNYGKLRLAFAQGGNSPSVYSTNTYYIVPSFADGMTDGNAFPFLGQNGYTLSRTLGNKDLKPEKSTEIEVGLDLKFFNNRIGFELTWYNKESKDILVSRPIAGSSGFQAIMSNSGKMRNRGVELVGNLVPIKLRKFEWRVDLNFTKNTNEVLELAPNVKEVSVEDAFTSIGSYAIKGEPYGVLYATKWERNDKGELIIKSNGLPKVSSVRGKIGNPFPDWTAGIRNTFTYKGISVSALIDIREGGMGWCGTIARMHRLGRTAESADRERTYIIKGVTETGQPNTTPITAFNYFSHYLGDGSQSATENSVYNTSWIRLRELSLNYRISKLPKRFAWVKFVEFNFVGRNLWLNTDYPGVDPETSLTGAGSNLTGFDYFNNPGTKTYSFGVKFGLF